MVQWLNPVLHLQSIDMELMELRKKVTAIPLVLKSLDSDLVTIANDEKAAVKVLQEFEIALKKIEIATETQEKLARKLEAQSAQVKSSDEFDAMKTEMSRAEVKAEELEEEALELLIIIEEYNEKLVGIRQECKNRVTAVGDKRVKLTKLAKDSAALIVIKTAERTKDVLVVDTEILDIYEKVRKRKKDVIPVFAPLNAEFKCGSCHLKNNSESKISITKGKVVFCDNCGAILYLPENVNG